MKTEPKNLFLFNKNRLLVLKLLLDCENDICGCDLVDKIGVSKHLISYHMKKLYKEGFVKPVKCGNRKKYIIKKNKKEIIKNALKATQLL